MTPALTGGDSGNMVIKLTLKNVGRIRRTSGTRKPKVFRERVAIIRKLHKMEMYDLLRAFKNGDVPIETLVEADRKERLSHTMVDLTLKAPLWDAVEATLPRMGKAPRTRQRYAQSFRSLQKKAKSVLGDRAIVNDLLAVDWGKVFENWGATPADRQNLRIALSAFASTFLNDKYHEFARKLRRAVPPVRVVPRRRSISAGQFKQLTDAMPPNAEATLWVLALTGMRIGEYLALRLEHLDESRLRVHVPGTKTAGSKDVIELAERAFTIVRNATPPKISYGRLRVHWGRAIKRAGMEGLHLHDLRHAAGRWARDLGVPAEDVQRFLRHESLDQTNDYTTLDATRHVSEAITGHLLGIEQKEKKA